MKNLQINLSTRFALAFGIQNKIEKVEISKINNDYSLSYYPQKTENIDYSKFTFSYGKKIETLEFSSVLKGVTGNIFAPPLMITFSQEKNLIETEICDDTPVLDAENNIISYDNIQVVERWGSKPWNIEIKGLLIDLENRIYPTKEINRLNQLWKTGNIVDVDGIQFIEKDIFSIFIKSIDFTPLEGYQDTIQFSMSAYSMNPVSFVLGKAEN